MGEKNVGEKKEEELGPDGTPFLTAEEEADLLDLWKQGWECWKEFLEKQRAKEEMGSEQLKKKSKKGHRPAATVQDTEKVDQKRNKLRRWTNGWSFLRAERLGGLSLEALRVIEFGGHRPMHLQICSNVANAMYVPCGHQRQQQHQRKCGPKHSSLICSNLVFQDGSSR